MSECESAARPDSSAAGDVLRVDDLQTAFPFGDRMVNAVDRVCFTVGRGRIVGLVGESGCGKSMTALSIMRLVPAPGRLAGGVIELDGHGDIGSIPEREMRSIRGGDLAMIFQDPMTSLNPVMRVGEQIVEGLRFHRRISRREARDRAIQMLTLVGIGDPELRAREYPHQMSGGMCQRVMIAMALACEPKVMLADEPTTALDVTIQAQILNLMRDVRDRTGTAIVLITHDLGVVAEMADDVCVMYAGEIVERAPVRCIFREPLHPYTIGLLESVSIGQGAVHRKTMLPAISGMVPGLGQLPGGCRFADRCRHATMLCKEHRPPLEELEPGRLVRCWLHVENSPMRVEPRAEAGALSNV
ncbi:peptide ABC transporter ATP-binding protein [Candidimonas nitroreducens]|uniref:Peptide ABC transporter ATP-binding protein n=2 Tax=Candidimonas nitroreducens TaxID=683354 RepID=A0A225N142_9BURK|nr:peptide ABC transporter ATP-binding protein [Candidimonas nitroreducens]